MRFKHTLLDRAIAIGITSLMVGTTSLTLVSTTTFVGGSPAYAQNQPLDRRGRIGTWNLQGSNASTENKWNTNVANLIRDQRLDILALQEAGDVPQSALDRGGQSPANLRTTGWGNGIGDGIDVDQYTWKGTQTRPGYYIYWANTDPRGNRVNLAIVTRRQADQVISFTPPCARRPVIGVRIGNAWFFTVHARSGGGNDASAIVSATDAVVAQLERDNFLAAGTYRWFNLGDWNREPATLPNNIAGSTSNAEPTYSANNPQRRYDYLIYRTGIDFARLVAAVITISAALSDHKPATFDYTRRGN